MSDITLAKPRVNFASVKNPLPYPDFLEVQLKSFQDFLQLDTPPEKRKNEGLFKVFAENFPIADTITSTRRATRLTSVLNVV